jgi:hypothetical protein
MSQSVVLNWSELQSVLEPLIQQIVQQELKKLVSTPVASQEKMTQMQWQELIRETSGSWPEMPMAEEIREGWDNFTRRESF